MSEKEEKSITQYLKEIKQGIEDNKIKQVKVPWRAKVNRRRMRKNQCIVLYVGQNKNAELVRGTIEDLTVKVGDLIHTVTPDDIIMFRGKFPFVIIPEWNIKPVTFWQPKKDYEEAEEEGQLTTPQRHILSKLESGIIKAKKTLKAGGWIMLIVAAIAVVYFISQGGLSGG